MFAPHPLCVGLLLVLPQIAFAAKPSTTPSARPEFATQAPGLIQLSTGSNSSFKNASGDTFCLYGGPGSLEGKFQDMSGVIPDAQGWTHRDVTDLVSSWQISSFNSPTASQSAWAGRSAAQEPGWFTAPGYGNGWYEILEYRHTVGDPSIGQTAGLSFVFNHDTEPGYDYFIVEYDSAGTTLGCLMLDGSNKDSSGVFTPLNYPGGVAPSRTISYQGNDYAGAGGDEIVIRLIVSSDAAWSDQDGLWPSDGAAQLDDITVTHADGSDFEDFESGFQHWQPSKAPFAGDFSKLFPRVTDLDVCLENMTPVIGFLDDGTPASNPGGTLPNGDPIPSIGTTSTNWSYGVPGGWVVNYNGGVSFGALSLDNEWWSPEIDWDLPGTADDDAETVGAFLRFSVYEHLPLINGFFWQWSVRGRDLNTGVWSQWIDRRFVYYSASTRWANNQVNFTDLVPIDKDKVQVNLAVRDLASLFAFAGTDATISPIFDNVSVQKYRVGGPAISTRTIDIFGDSFAQSGLADVSTQAARDLLDCRVDMSRSVSTGDLNTPGDSMIADVKSILPGIAISDSLTQISLHYSLSMNPLFEAAIRANAPINSVGGGRFGWDEHEGVVAPSQAATSTGNPIANRYAFDLPDADFMYPGDVLEYYIEAVDDAGHTTTLPANLDGFGDGSGDYSRVWTVRALPTYQNTVGSHPRILWWNDFGHRGGEDEMLLAFDHNGLGEGIHYDTYTTKGPSSMVDNGLGSAGAHGATLAQLSGYDCIFYEGGDLSGGLISDGTNATGAGGNTNDKGDDVGLLTAWYKSVGIARNIAHFGDNIASYMAAGNSAHTTYLATVMGVTVNDADVRDEIDNQTTPRALPTSAFLTFYSEFVALGGCPVLNRFDSIQPSAGAVSIYGFERYNSPGAIYPGVSAGVAYLGYDGLGATKRAVTFPLGFRSVADDPGQTEFARSALMASLLYFFGAHYIPCPLGGCPDAPAAFTLSRVASYPNPFNPSTTIRFDLTQEADGSVRIFDVRGKLIRTLAWGHFEGGRNELQWNGRDDSGASVASGVYLVRADIGGQRQQQKLVLLK